MGFISKNKIKMLIILSLLIFYIDVHAQSLPLYITVDGSIDWAENPEFDEILIYTKDEILILEGDLEEELSRLVYWNVRVTGKIYENDLWIKKFRFFHIENYSVVDNEQIYGIVLDLYEKKYLLSQQYYVYEILNPSRIYVPENCTILLDKDKNKIFMENQKKLEVRQYRPGKVFRENFQNFIIETPKCIGYLDVEGVVFQDNYGNPMIKNTIGEIFHLYGELAEELKKILNIKVRIMGGLLPQPLPQPLDVKKKISVMGYVAIDDGYYLGTLRQSKEGLVLVGEDLIIYQIANPESLAKAVDSKVLLKGTATSKGNYRAVLQVQSMTIVQSNKK